ncbi:MAG: aspartate aminotransferase family protein [Cyclobacteriaceae bacterium]
MTSEEFRKNAHKAVDWVADYLENIEHYPVKSQVAPGDIGNQIPSYPPEDSEVFDNLMSDLDQIIMPGITHWQHPNFHAYFSGNNSYPSIIAELLTAGLGAQCMIWETSPAAAELEEKMMEWLKSLMGLPKQWHGVIQDTASTSTLAAILTAREQKTKSNQLGMSAERLRIYCSTQTHSSIDKAVRIAGIGSNNLVKVDVDEHLAMNPEKLAHAIKNDLSAGYVPTAVVSTLGTTSTLAMDPVDAIDNIAKQYQIWHHVDAAYAGSAFVLPHERPAGLTHIDSYVFNPHKWLFTNFDCSAYYVKDKDKLIDTFEILPEYLKTGTRGRVNDYRDWGIPLGRRFRALKLWFVLRTFGAKGIRARISDHIDHGKWLAEQIDSHISFELLIPRTLNLVVFRYKTSQGDPNVLNQSLLEQINASGRAYLTHTKINGNYGLRLVAGQTYLKRKHIENVWKLICSTAASLDQ